MTVLAGGPLVLTDPDAPEPRSVGYTDGGTDMAWPSPPKHYTRDERRTYYCGFASARIELARQRRQEKERAHA